MDSKKMNILKVSFNVKDGNQFGEFIIPATAFEETIEFFKVNLPLNKTTTIVIEPIGYMSTSHVAENYRKT